MQYICVDNSILFTIFDDVLTTYERRQWIFSLHRAVK